MCGWFKAGKHETQAELQPQVEETEATRRPNANFF